jgi:hypothetical protein
MTSVPIGYSVIANPDNHVHVQNVNLIVHLNVHLIRVGLVQKGPLFLSFHGHVVTVLSSGSGCPKTDDKY